MMIRIIQDHASSSSKVEIRHHHQAHPPHVAAPLGSPVVVRWHAQPLRVARSLTSLLPNGQWLQRECSASVEPDRPRALMIEVVVVRSDEDDSHALPKRMTNEDVSRLQCHTAADIVCTYSLHAKQYSAMRQYTRAQKYKWPLNRQRWLIYRQLGQWPRIMVGRSSKLLLVLLMILIRYKPVNYIANLSRCSWIL